VRTSQKIITECQIIGDKIEVKLADQSIPKCLQGTIGSEFPPFYRL